VVTRKRLLDLFVNMLEINSPSKDERRLADFVRPALEALGYEVYEDDAGRKIGGNTGNLLAFKQGASKTGAQILFSAHMDTVQPTSGLRAVTTDDGIIKTDGSTILGSDDKAGVAAIIEALRVVEEESIPYRSVQVIFDVAEEIGLLGAKAVPREAIRADLAYVFDMEKPVASIVVAGPSHDNIRAKFTGKAAHAGIRPEAGVSAVVAASKAIANMKLGRVDFETTANVGVIKGGTAHNIVPEEAVVSAEARSRSEEKLAAQVRHMAEAFHDAAAEVGTSVDIEIEREYYSYRWGKDDPVVQLGITAGQAVGIEPELIEANGGSDANIYNEIGVPAVLVGVGCEAVHSPQEQIAIDDLVKCAEFAVELVRRSVAIG